MYGILDEKGEPMTEQNSIAKDGPPGAEKQVIATTTITREIGIDAGHRVTNHGSKCRNIHGHRYRIEATMIGVLATSGEEEGMVLDYGFLKEEMMACIDSLFDHGMILWRRDPLILSTLSSPEIEHVDQSIPQFGIGFLPKSTFWGKLVVIPVVPTAENLAKVWFDLLAPAVLERSHKRGRLLMIDTWETPNCRATYMP